jgi:hypothetical protein
MSALIRRRNRLSALSAQGVLLDVIYCSDTSRSCMTATPSSRPRSGRRESSSNTAGSGPGRVRKNSVANSGVGGSGGVGTAGMRPRANTISHVDNATLGMLAAANSAVGRHGNMGLGHGHHATVNSLPGPGGYDYKGMSSAVGTMAIIMDFRSSKHTG